MACNLFFEQEYLCTGSGIASSTLVDNEHTDTSIIEAETYPVRGMRRNI